MNMAARRGSVLIKDVWISPSRRAPDPKAVERLASSIREIGLLTPITVRVADIVTDPVEGEITDVTALVTGRHRLEAMRSLGADKIDCFYLDLDALHAELAEIDENLIRANLTPAQEAQAVARRKAIYEELYPETKAGANASTARKTSDNLSFVSATSEAVGRDRRTVERAAARGRALGDDLNAIAGTSLDKGAELDALVKMPLSERASVISRAKAGENVSARPSKPTKVAADPLTDELAAEKQVARLMDAWNAAGPDARAEFLLRIDQPIMDARYGSAA